MMRALTEYITADTNVCNILIMLLALEISPEDSRIYFHIIPDI